MKLIGEGRTADVFALDARRVLRRYRGGESAMDEARLMAYVRSHGFPTPEVFDAEGPDLVMERLDGPSLFADLARRPWRVLQCGGVLAALHDQLHVIPAPTWLTPASHLTTTGAIHGTHTPDEPGTTVIPNSTSTASAAHETGPVDGAASASGTGSADEVSSEGGARPARETEPIGEAASASGMGPVGGGASAGEARSASRAASVGDAGTASGTGSVWERAGRGQDDAAARPFRQPDPVSHRVLHLDLHPLNIIMTPSGPSLIDWCNARAGDPAFDVATTFVLMTAAELPGRAVRLGVKALTWAFLRASRTDPGPRVVDAALARIRDPNTTPSEVERLRGIIAAHDLQSQ